MTNNSLKKKNKNNPTSILQTWMKASSRTMRSKITSLLRVILNLIFSNNILNSLRSQGEYLSKTRFLFTSVFEVSISIFQEKKSLNYLKRCFELGIRRSKSLDFSQEEQMTWRQRATDCLITAILRVLAINRSIWLWLRSSISVTINSSSDTVSLQFKNCLTMLGK
jgi:hypothetical protein